jgi:hypothetical protein
VSPSSRRRPAVRWRAALALSLALHGLALFSLAHVPCGVFVRPGPAGGDDGGEAPPPEESPEPVCFLTSGPTPTSRPARPAPKPPAAPAPQAVAPPRTAPVPPPAEITVLPDPPRPNGAEPGSFASSGRGAGPVPPAGTTTFFQVPARAEAVVYVIDRSASMGLGGRLDAARRELLASLERLPETARFQVLVYNSTTEPLLPDRPGLLPATAENKRRVAAALAGLQAEGGTRHDQALPRALALLPDVIFFLTDADDLTEDHLRAVTARNRGRSVIHVIELNPANRNRPDRPLQVLARQSHGVYQAVDLANYP